MSTIKLIIADENHSYANGLSQYLQQEYGQAFDIVCFTQKTVLQEHLNKGEAADILLIDQKLFNEHLSIKFIKSVVMLIENPTERSFNSIIYKYQKADQIARLLLEIYDKHSSGSIHIIRSKKKAKLICVYSPAGSAGKTTIAYNLAYQYILQSQRALYISFEAYTDMPLFKQDETNRGLNYLLYLIKNKLPNLQLKLDTIKAVDENTNVHFIQRENNVLEYKDISMEDMELLTSFLREQSGYDAVILDLDSTINEIVLGAFKYCDYIVNVKGMENPEHGKSRDFQRQLTRISNHLKLDICSKLIWVSNKSKNEKSLDSKDTYEGIEHAIIPYISNIAAGLGIWSSEMKYFKQLYELLENGRTGTGEYDE